MIDVDRLTNGAWMVRVVEERPMRRALVQHTNTSFAWWVEAVLLEDEQLVDDLFDSLDERLLGAMVQRGHQRLAATG